MRLWLVRHGEAKTAFEDPERPLSDGGRAEVERLAAWAARCGVAPEEILHSDLRRAVETAGLLAARLAPPAGTRAAPGLAPGDAVEPWVGRLRVETRDVMLVGHLPFLGYLASALLAGDAGRGVVGFVPGAMACLVREDGEWTLAWAVTPDLAG